MVTFSESDKLPQLKFENQLWQLLDYGSWQTSLYSSAEKQGDFTGNLKFTHLKFQKSNKKTFLQVDSSFLVSNVKMHRSPSVYLSKLYFKYASLFIAALLKCNSHIIKLTLLKYKTVIFDIIRVGKSELYSQNVFHSRRKLCSISRHSSLSLGNASSPSVSLNLLILDTVCGFSWIL